MNERYLQIAAGLSIEPLIGRPPAAYLWHANGLKDCFLGCFQEPSARTVS
jgi:hypothetical protein